MINELCKPSKEFHSLQKLNSDPQELKSDENRYIQLADALAFILVRYFQFEITTFDISDNLIKHKTFIMKCFDLIQNKIISITHIRNFIKLINPGEFTKRDFNHMGSWTSKKRMDDKYNPSFNKRYKESESKMILLNQSLENILDNTNEHKILLNTEIEVKMEMKINEIDKILIKSGSEFSMEMKTRIENNIKRIRRYLSKK